MFQLTSVLVLSDVVVIFLRSSVALTPNGYFWVVPILHSVSDTFKLFFRTKNNVLAAALVAGTVKLTHSNASVSTLFSPSLISHSISLQNQSVPKLKSVLLLAVEIKNTCCQTSSVH